MELIEIGDLEINLDHVLAVGNFNEEIFALYLVHPIIGRLEDPQYVIYFRKTEGEGSVEVPLDEMVRIKRGVYEE